MLMACALNKFGKYSGVNGVERGSTVMGSESTVMGSESTVMGSESTVMGSESTDGNRR